MEYRTLGRTGLRVSVAGLGCGGNSQLGLGQGKSEADAIRLVRAAFDLGVNFLDTAEAYGTEEVVGKAIAGRPRESVVISTKSRIRAGGERLSPAEILANLDASLRRLATDHVDIFHLHAVPEADYDWVMSEVLPGLIRVKEQGKIRHLGITESSPRDPDQVMLQRAVNDECWKVMMFAFHMMHQVAREALFPATQRNGIGTLLMFVVRNIFSRPGLLSETMRARAEEGKVDRSFAAMEQPLGFLVHEGGARSIIDAAYRFARHEPGADVVLFGTGSIEHLKSNVNSILAPPLPREDVERLYTLFGHLRGVGLDLPDRSRVYPKG